MYSNKLLYLRALKDLSNETNPCLRELAVGVSWYKFVHELQSGALFLDVKKSVETSLTILK